MHIASVITCPEVVQNTDGAQLQELEEVLLEKASVADGVADSLVHGVDGEALASQGALHEIAVAVPLLGVLTVEALFIEVELLLEQVRARAAGGQLLFLQLRCQRGIVDAVHSVNRRHHSGRGGGGAAGALLHSAGRFRPVCPGAGKQQQLGGLLGIEGAGAERLPSSGGVKAQLHEAGMAGGLLGVSLQGAGYGAGAQSVVRLQLGQLARDPRILGICQSLPLPLHLQLVWVEEDRNCNPPLRDLGHVWHSVPLRAKDDHVGILQE
mmetsp:Transcript_113600/g.331929  ORF Transcript_113600/g.331929 Transcript_113600/m.331929 type:complete len:267 (-) Transcript_113600:874-1674(-)